MLGKNGDVDGARSLDPTIVNLGVFSFGRIGKLTETGGFRTLVLGVG